MNSQDLVKEFAEPNLTRDPAHRVHAITMPLVRLMRDGNLSWADKEEIAGVIRDVMREAQSMRNEQKHIGQVGQQAGLGGMR